MSRRRLLAGLVGVALLGVALSTDVSLPLGPLVDWVGSDYLLVAAVGGVSLVLSVPVLAGGRATNLDQTETPDPERPATARPAGHELDDLRTSAALAVPVVGVAGRRLRGRLRLAATGTVARSTGCRRKTARARVERGEWCDDPVATAFLADEQRLGLSVWVGSLLRATHPYERATRRVLRELRAVERGERT